MKRSLLLTALAGVCLAGALAGCGGSSDSPKDGGSNGSNTTLLRGSTPKATKDIDTVTMTVAQGEANTLDWIKSSNYPNNEVLSNMCESLGRENPDYTTSPGLAEKFENTDPTTWVYTIRPGVKFWDGNPLTAADVVFSLDRARDPKSGSLYLAAFMNVKSVAQTGPMQVTVKLSKPDVIFAEAMYGPAGEIAEKAYVQAKGSSYGTPDGGVMCTGPFEFGSWQQGSAITLKRNPNYWDPSLRAHAQTLVFKTVGKESTVTSALVSGAIDGMYDVPVSGIPQLQNSSVGKLYQGVSQQSFAIIPANPNSPLAKEPKLRQALSYAINYDGIIKTIMNGTAQPLRTIAAPGTWGDSVSVYQKAYDALPAPKFDIAKAKQLAQEAGIPAKPIVIGVPAEQQSIVDIFTAIQSSAKQAGIPVEVKTIPLANYNPLFFDPKARQKVDAFFTNFYPDVTDPLAFYYVMTVPGTPFNYEGYDNPKVTALLNQGRATYDATARANLVVQAQKLITADLPWIPILSPNTRLFMNNKITGAPATFVYMAYPWAAQIGGK